ncbi:MAG: CPBP family intramembrane metalloprotease [Chitinophagaceae bacterium]|nr:CPBP family intramembrane metalloprotease [Chitinophagaceae bacterium]
MKLFKTSAGHLRQIWWVVIFFLVLAAITFPVIFLSQQYHWEITVLHQALIVLAATFISQLLRKKPFSEIAGTINFTWVKNLLQGILLGALLMFLPALILYLGGWVRFEIQPIDAKVLLNATVVFISVAVAEEFLFRGFIFQRLTGSMGVWPAQLIIAAYFLLIHINNPGMEGTIKLLASANIFTASLLFGFAFLKTKSLAMPIGIHFMANWMQGTLLGFGVSGNDEAGILKPLFVQAPAWLTGGTFGLEASLFGLVSLVIITAAFYTWYPSKQLNSIN